MHVTVRHCDAKGADDQHDGTCLWNSDVFSSHFYLLCRPSDIAVSRPVEYSEQQGTLLHSLTCGEWAIALHGMYESFF